MKKTARMWFLFVLLLFSPSVFSEGDYPDQKTIYFYNPEANINNFVSLKIAFDTYLSKFGNYKFQPFNDQQLFEQTVAEKPAGIFLLSSWHYQLLSKNLNLAPLMVGVYNGKSTQKKILISHHEIVGINDLKDKTIASPGSEDYTKKLLSSMIGSQYNEILNSINVILVPKDIDALLSVGFGISSAAITSARSFENLKNINKKQFELLKGMVVSKPYYLTIASSLNSTQQNLTEFIDILEKMGINRDGEILLRMIGLDAWRKISKNELLLLDKHRQVMSD